MNMIYLGLEICDYKQLITIGFPLMRSLEEKIDSVIKQNDIRFLKKKGGFYVLSMGEEAEADPKDVLDAAFQLAHTVKEFREDLYGFNLFLATYEDQRLSNVESKLASSFLELLEEEGVWIHNRDAEYFKDHALFQAGDQFTKIIERRKAEPVYNVISQVPRIRRRIIRRLAQVFLKWFSRSDQRPALLLVTGPADSAKREIVSAALEAVVGKERRAFIQVIGSGDPASPPLAPLLGSMRSTREIFWKRLPHYLTPHEKQIWKTSESFILPLLDGKPISGDHVEEDFFIIYNLYLVSCFRLLQELMLPAIIVFHNPRGLASSLASRLETLFNDLSRRFRLAVVVVSSRPHIPLPFRDFQKTRVRIRPFDQAGVRNCFTALYPGVAVPRRVVEQINRLSRGRYGSILHLIYYLRLHRKIVQEANRFVWVAKSALRIKIPSGPRTAGLAIIRSLKEEARTVLFVAQSLGGLLAEKELHDFFSTIGLNPRKVSEQLAYLRSLRLLSGGADTRASRFLKAVLRRLAPQKTKYLDEQMRGYLRGRLEVFLPLRAVRCFRLLASLGAPDAVVDHLATVINYFLEARLLAQAEYFLEPRHYLSLENLTEEKRRLLEYILFSSRLRLCLLSGNIAAADKEVSRNILPTESLMPQSVFARLYLELGRHAMSKEDIGKALPHFKKAAHYFQELKMISPSSEAFLELGCGFLAKGNLKEALEYFSFAKKMIQDLSAPTLQIRSLWFESVALYLAGNYSRILANCDEAALLSAGHGFREAELLFGFLKARAMFDLGFYERSSHLLRECLCQARLYDLPRARRPLYAWLARSAIYQRQTEYALALLGKAEENAETMFIKAEAHFLIGEDKKAEKLFTKALHAKPPPACLYPEYNAWESGFSLVEGRCLDLNTHGHPLVRLARLFRAVLQCRAGRLEEGIAELHLLTITEKFAPADPHVCLFYFLYYLVLKNLDKKETSLQEIGHGLTILNKALKHLQERSTVIDEPRDRIQYITQNYWNKLIFEEAKANKLV